MKGLSARQMERLERLAVISGKPVENLLQQLVESGLEDLEDYYLASGVMARVRQGKEKLHALEDVERDLGLSIQGGGSGGGPT